MEIFHFPEQRKTFSDVHLSSSAAGERTDTDCPNLAVNVLVINLILRYRSRSLGLVPSRLLISKQIKMLASPLSTPPVAPHVDGQSIAYLFRFHFDFGEETPSSTCCTVKGVCQLQLAAAEKLLAAVQTIGRLVGKRFDLLFHVYQQHLNRYRYRLIIVPDRTGSLD